MKSLTWNQQQAWHDFAVALISSGKFSPGFYLHPDNNYKEIKESVDALCRIADKMVEEETLRCPSLAITHPL